jgi:predicted MPP superfamily phosphohydrolase
MLTRRLFLQASGGILVAGSGLGAYACAIEPGLCLDVTTYRVTPTGWPADHEMTCAIVADIHACEPWMSADRVRQIVAVTNALAPDITFLLGDFNAGHKYVSGAVYPHQWGEALEALTAPLGVYAVLGNHDWWHGALPSMRADGAESVRRALKHAGVKVLENHSVALTHHGRPFWVAGLADQMAVPGGRHGTFGYDDLGGTLAQVTDDAPILLLAHEPYIFDDVPKRVSLTLCGHTHGGQVNIPILSPWYERRSIGTHHIYGHIVEGGRHMIISAGLGTSIAPIRFRRPPEIVLVTLGGSEATKGPAAA